MLGGWDCYTDQTLSWLGSCEGTNNFWVIREKLSWWEAGTDLSSDWCQCHSNWLLRESFGKQIALAESYLDNSDSAEKLFLKAAVISYLMQALLCWVQEYGKNSFSFWYLKALTASEWSNFFFAVRLMAASWLTKTLLALHLVCKALSSEGKKKSGWLTKLLAHCCTNRGDTEGQWPCKMLHAARCVDLFGDLERPGILLWWGGVTLLIFSKTQHLSGWSHGDASLEPPLGKLGPEEGASMFFALLTVSLAFRCCPTAVHF